MKTLKIGAVALLMVGSTLALSACADGYRDDYSSVSIGVSSSGGTGHRHRGAYGDRDHDGVPNVYDEHPNNPYRD